MCRISDPATFNNLDDSDIQQLTQWWNDIVRQAELDNTFSEQAELTEKASSLKRNLENDLLFELSDTCQERLASFASQLGQIDNETNPIKRATEAIKAQDSLSVVCAGPPATPPSNPLVRLIRADDFYRYNSREARPPEKHFGDGQDIQQLKEWLDDLLEDHDLYYDIIKEPIQGKNPVAFWACQADIEEISDSTADRIRSLLGMDTLDISYPHILVSTSVQQLENNQIPRKVPTGWDAFDNKHFRPTIPSGSGDLPQIGQTYDLNREFPSEEKGAHELVTPPVAIRLTEPYQVIT